MSYTPAPYATAEELKKYLGFQADTLMAEYSEEGALTEMGTVLTDTSAMIDSMISGRVSVPVANGNAVLKRICLTVAKYDLWSRQSASDVPEALKNDYAAQMKVLERIARGEIAFAADSAEVTVVEPEFTSKSQAFNAVMD